MNRVLTGFIAFVVMGAIVAHLWMFRRIIPRPLSFGRLIVAGAVVDLLIQTTSVGGGVIILPLLLAVLPPHEAVGSEVTYGFIVATLNALLHLRVGQVTWVPLLLMLLGAVPGIKVGGYLYSQMSGVTVRMTVLGVLLIVSVLLLLRAWTSF